MKESINYEADYRTAPATPGLLNMVSFSTIYYSFLKNTQKIKFTLLYIFHM